MIALFIVLYIIIAILVIMGYIFYETRVKHEKVNLDDEEHAWIFLAGLFWPMYAIGGTVWLICHGVFIFFDWFANSLQDKEES